MAVCNDDETGDGNQVFAPGEPKKIACQLTVFEPHWLSLFYAPSDPQLGTTIIGQL